MAAAPTMIQRSDLPPPSPAASPRVSSKREVALAQPFPAAQPRGKSQSMLAPPRASAGDKLTTGSLPKENGWSAENAPSVTMRPGESVAVIARRYGVPEKELLRVNGLKSAAAAQPGQSLLIPTYKGGSLAKASAEGADLSSNEKMPPAPKMPEQKVAVLPAGTSARDKASLSAEGTAGKVASGDGKAPKGPSGTYVVKPGDSIAKIAKATGSSVEEIKKANNLNTASLRVGQDLKIPSGTIPADAVKTAAIPVKADAKAAATATEDTAAATKQAAVSQPQPYKAPAATQSVEDAEKKSDVASAAPEASGIGKYRWPVRGAVIAGYGTNVNGSRNEGIDISVPQGTPIKAAENGVVIYAGNGLKQLGNTVLLRHDDGTVTVYGNADSLNVTRGQKIQRGQTLAVSGMSGDVKQPQLHFEVRKDATPVNPMTFLE